MTATKAVRRPLTRDDLAAHVQPVGDCLLWTGYTLPNGYGHVRGVYVHRRAYELAVGRPIPPGMVIDHICHDPRACSLGRECPHRRCVNPEHLRVVTSQENSARSTWTARTHCDHGHEFVGDNVGRKANGARYCRTCHRARPPRALDPSQKLIREWARNEGLPVGERGPLSSEGRGSYARAEVDRAKAEREAVA